jgi:hypothetical protein
MQKNEGQTDRIIRAIVGVVVLILAYTTLSGALQIVAYVVGVISIVTSITGFCLLYKLLGIDTSKK